MHFILVERSQDRFKGDLAVGRLLDHITLTGLLEEYQSAYKMLHSTQTALLRVQHDITSELGKNRVALFVMLDISSAFAPIDHEHDDLYIKTSYHDVRRLLLDNWRRYGFTEFTWTNI